MVQSGDSVQFRGGVIPEQVKWSGADYPSDLVIGQMYVVETADIRFHYTNITLVGVPGKFNLVNFQLM